MHHKAMLSESLQTGAGHFSIIYPQSYTGRYFAGTYMTPESIFFIIQKAKEDEERTGNFAKQLATKVSQLHLAVGLHGVDPLSCLFNFAVEYIEMAPRLIECVQACADEAGEMDLFAPFIYHAVGYFTQPSVVFSKYIGLDGLLIKAYLCHRLMEEMYENNKSIRNSDLVDIETTQANLLAHHLIGEPFANELDQAILITVCQLAGTPNYYELDLNPFVIQAKHKAWEWMRIYWQNLLVRNHIKFQFSLKPVPPHRY
jgi:hypothetical protein